jgi:hypothetical protein
MRNAIKDWLRKITPEKCRKSVLAERRKSALAERRKSALAERRKTTRKVVPRLASGHQT